jgi:hypothetical protein
MENEPDELKKKPVHRRKSKEEFHVEDVDRFEAEGFGARMNVSGKSSSQLWVFIGWSILISTTILSLAHFAQIILTGLK